MNKSTLVPREEWESDLDWLARNVHSWPESTPHIIPVGDCVFEFGATFFENHVCLYHREFADSKVIHKHQWLARRAELQNKPSWANAIPAAEFLAQDATGDWTWFGGRPEEYSDRFDIVLDGYEEYSGMIGEVLGDWRDTLEKRPVDLSEQAVTDRLQDATANVLAAAPELMKDKFKFEPFVSVEDAATAKQPEPKGIGNPILGMVLADLTNRALEGKEKYGEPLLAHNGRNALWDAYQEALDLAMYLRQAIEEQKQ
jgi:hypothetical protein